MTKIRIMRKELKEEEENPRVFLTHPDNPEQVEMAIERLFPKGTTYKRLPTQRGSFRDLQAGILGMRSRLFTIPNEGTVLYQRYDIHRGYVAEVELLGFREQSDIYKNLRDSLERMASTNSNPFD